MTAVLVDGVGRVCIVDRDPLPKQQIVWHGYTFTRDPAATINEWPVYRLDGYPRVPIRWGLESRTP